MLEINEICIFNNFPSQIIFTLLVSSATCRTAKKYREMVESARLSQADYPMYNLIAPNGKYKYLNMIQ